MRTLDVVPRGRRRLALSVLLASLASGASVALMAVSAWLLSRAAEHPPVLYLEAAAVGVRFFGILRGVARYAERLVGHDLALRMQGALRLHAYDRLSRTTLLGSRQGDLLTRLVADVEAVQDVVVRVLVPLCSASIVMLGTSIALAFFSPGSAAVLLASALAAGILLPWLAQRLSRTADARAVAARAELAVAMHELARNAPDLVAYGRGRARLDRQAALQDRLETADRRAAWTRGLATAGQVLAAGIAVIAALWVGGRAVAGGVLLGRNLAVLVLTPLALHEVLATFTQAAQTWTRARTSLVRVQSLLDAPSVGRGDRPPAEACDEPGLELCGVTIGWPGGHALAEDLNLVVRRGDRVAITGPSGVGKTTLAATVMGLIPPLSGRVITRGQVGFLAQDAHIFATSVAENVRIGNRDADEARVAAALAAAGLDLPADRIVGEQGATLSGGEVRRLALARLLAGDPGTPQTAQVFVLDEPTEHLDAETAETLMEDLWRVCGDSPVIVVTHDPEVVAQCSRVVQMAPSRAGCTARR
ncbi:MAG: thiol reductant ABC exporter subunit CydC [Luteococcus sp.]|uniref:thiol reductant ABC exporter subunit CydC n=1 Tax=Luteococcus sp. TaxID=1969402 RepID=UPI002648BD16|nr:thiol reductant ABC exporter subunit CydC [Luteococcus sp.]MDN5563103.1 thiol reductant ABC exporter subunit CydC [Luteococcus sp.]